MKKPKSKLDYLKKIIDKIEQWLLKLMGWK
jgi:hypothetical protein